MNCSEVVDGSSLEVFLVDRFTSWTSDDLEIISSDRSSGSSLKLVNFSFSLSFD